MNLVDANVLLYADNEVAKHHRDSRLWLTAALSGAEPLLVPWLSMVAYLRISTTAQLHQLPRSTEGAIQFVRTILNSTSVFTGDPDHRHLERMETLLSATGSGGNLVNDAYLAALALQYDATVISYDNDFDRFPGVRWERPSAPPA